MPGPPRTPTTILETRGSRLAPDRRKGEPKPPKTAPKCPSFLDDEAKKKWKDVAPVLERMGVLSLVDGDVLAAYCQAWSEFRLATETLKEEGRIMTRANGSIASHPMVHQQRTAWKAVKDFAAILGLDPSNRSKLNVPAPTGTLPTRQRPRIATGTEGA